MASGVHGMIDLTVPGGGLSLTAVGTSLADCCGRAAKSDCGLIYRMLWENVLSELEKVNGWILTDLW